MTWPPCGLYLEFVEHALNIAVDQVAVLVTDECRNAWLTSERKQDIRSMRKSTKSWIIRHKGEYLDLTCRFGDPTSGQIRYQCNTKFDLASAPTFQN